MKAPPLPSILATLFTAFLLSWEVHGQLFNLTDTPTTFAGSFSVGTSASPDEALTAVIPELFVALPQDSSHTFPTEFNGLAVGRGPIDDTGDLYAIVGTFFLGSPDDPRYFVPATDTGFQTLSGQYANGGPDGNLIVTWSFTNLHDTGGPDGIFSGDFSFTLVAVPEPGAYAAISGFAMLAFAAWRRRSS